MFNKIKEFFKARKTFIISIIMALFNVATSFGYINLSLEQTAAINGFFAAAGLTTLRLGMMKPTRD